MKDMFMQCCQNMMAMMGNGMPMMMSCGGMMMMGMMPTKA
ncbi:cobyrinic acid a,c-diamide synthase [Rhodopseudomonas rhenobacensis]|uniref:Cobyrinic acid a,c-diamide synthase n=1 Tax=Rhodopseudomonas rhenobacensis TaxID=87461 RepID=A0A7W7Z341_9BRAD|nr:cobyrinic acid a,c-diamide synthase [Rhodopseudomonas rhenobacensis]